MTALNPSPLVSVVTPARNRDAVLAEAIESVLEQTMPEFELILVDDASTDGTRSVMHRYKRLDRRVKVVANDTPSRGGPIEWEVRNNGLQLARGRHIAYLDSDNRWRPTFLERLSAVLEAHREVQLVHCDACNHYGPGEVGAVLARDRRTLRASGPDWTVFSYDRLDATRLGSEIYIDTNEIMHRASVFHALGSLWRTAHPDRDRVNARQWPRRPQRRHNDLDLVERVIARFGDWTVAHVPEALVDFYYPSAPRQGVTPRLSLV